MASSSSSPSEVFEVFLSFRGEDTRKGFTGHLYEALNSRGIHTFMDSQRLEFGESIGDNLWNAIEGSSICIPIFSQNYAESRWCLMELAKMVGCKKTIIPVFYHVNPSDVRKQKGPFQKAFLKYEHSSDHKNKVDEWRKALTRVCELKGFNLHNDAYGHEAMFIKLIIKEVLGKLQNYMPLPFTGHLVGIDSRVEDVMKLLSIEKDDVRMIGIVGIGGIGKTTLSMVVYNQIFNEYEARSFLSNVREGSKGADGLMSLQKKLLCAILRDYDVKINDITEGEMMIKQRFSRKKSLIIVDDVDTEEQLKALAGEKTWFGQGSRIMITTRDEHVLNVHGLIADEIYRPNELNIDDSLKLFSYHAFRRCRPTEDYTELSTKIVSTTGGLPLALEVIGSFLFDKRNVIEWKEFLQGLKEKTLIQEKLRTSYDGLNEEEKTIFLDIVCFFIGRHKVSPILFWQRCGLKANLAVKVLQHRSLIKIDESLQFQMHDQIRDMGRGIVSEMHPRDPGMHSRIWCADKALDVLTNGKGSRDVEGINLDHEETRGPFNTKSFKAMDNLRFLRANKSTIQGDFKDMPIGLRWLEWHLCPLKSLPNDFNLEKIFFLDLSFSKLTRVWNDGWFSPRKVFNDLTVLNISFCIDLKVTPDFSGCPNLEFLSLRFCSSLVYVNETICTLMRLRVLWLGWCKRLRELPSSIYNLPLLEQLDLAGCESLRKFPDVVRQISLFTPYSLDCPEKRRSSDLDNCLEQGQSPDTIICTMEDQNCLNLFPDTTIEELPDFVGDGFLCTQEGQSIEPFFRPLELQDWDVDDYLELGKLPDAIGTMEGLNYLNLSNIGIGELPDSIWKLTNLTKLYISSTRMEELPYSIGNLTNLTILDISNTKIKELPDSIERLQKLRVLKVKQCHKLKSLPWGKMKSLEELEVEGRGDEAFEDDHYFEGKHGFVSMSGLWKQSSSSTHQTESRLLQLKSATNRSSEWELLITVGADAARVVKVKAFYEEEWGLYRGMQWLRFIFSRDFVIDDEILHHSSLSLQQKRRFATLFSARSCFPCFKKHEKNQRGKTKARAFLHAFS